MAKRSKTLFYVRKFLNRRGRHAGAHIIGDVSLEVYKTYKQRTEAYAECSFTIADCSRQISLSFDTDNRNWANTLYKLDTLIGSLIKFREALVKAKEEADRINAEAKAAKVVAKPEPELVRLPLRLTA